MPVLMSKECFYSNVINTLFLYCISIVGIMLTYFKVQRHYKLVGITGFKVKIFIFCFYGLALELVNHSKYITRLGDEVADFS